MINKVVVTVAGKGTRMLHLTKNKAKHLINIKNKPFLCYLLANIFNAGYEEIVLVVGHKGEKFKDFLEKCQSCGKCEYKKITIVNQREILGEEKYGTACPLMCVKDIIGDEPFLYVYGDNLYSIRDLAAFRKLDKYNYVGGLIHSNPNKYGVLVATEDGFLKEIIEKPKEYAGNLINTSPFKFNSEVFEKLSKIKKSARGEYEITDVITLLAKEKKVKIKKLEDYWMDFGNPGDIVKLSRFLDSNHEDNKKQ